ncbi:MvhD2: coenzyme F420 non-reducing hydrogenase, delta subunit [Desulfosarcina variabilis str. Montpellier]
MKKDYEFRPKILGFLCNWCCYAGADLCGISRYQYPPNMKVIRLMCSGRIDPQFIFKSFLNGMDGVFIGGCWPGECHYITEGNYLAISMIQVCKKLMALIGLNPERLRLEWVSASEGVRYAEVITDLDDTLKGLGPLGKGEDIDPETLKFRIETVMSLLPYIKLVERERMRVPLETEAAYHEYFASSEFEQMFQELIADKLAVCQIMALIREKPRSSAELSNLLGLPSSEISRHVNIAARQGMCRFDESKNLIAAAYHQDADESVAEAAAEVKPAALGNKKIDQIIDTYKGNPGALIHVLMEVQSENQWLPKEILTLISEKLDVPLGRVMQIASFYKTFRLTPKGRYEIHVCNGTSCHLRGSERLIASVQEMIGIRPGEMDADSKFSLETGNCLGCCTLGPEMIIDGAHHGRISPDKAQALLKNCA